MLKKLSAIVLSTASAFAMHTAEINVNDLDLEVSAKFDVGQFNDAVEPDTMFVGAKFLNADESHSSDDPKSLDPYYEVSLLMMRPIGNGGMSLGMGAKMNYTKDYTAIPLGLEFAFKLPVKELIPMYINGSLYYAPTVLSLQDADNFLEYRISYDVEVIDNGRLTLGYRNINTNYDQGDLNYNSSWYIGFKIGF